MGKTSRLGAMVAVLFGPKPEPVSAEPQPGAFERGVAQGLPNVANACTVPPEGWVCTRAAGHDGPCAAVPTEEACAGWPAGCPCDTRCRRTGEALVGRTEPDPAIIEAALAYDPAPIPLVGRTGPFSGPALIPEEITAATVAKLRAAEPVVGFPVTGTEINLDGLHDGWKVGDTFSGPALVPKPIEGPSPEHLQRLAETRAELAARAEAAIDRLAEVAAEAAEEEPCDWPSCDCEKSSACGAMTARVRTAIAAEAQALNAAAPLQGREVDCIVCSRSPGGACPHDRLGVALPFDCTLASEIRRAARAEADKHPPGALINTTDVPLFDGGTGNHSGIGHYDPDWQRNAIEAAKNLAVEHRVIAHRVESERERRERLLAEWVAHREAAPMEPGRVPGEPMPRSEDELIAQARVLLNDGHPEGARFPDETMRLLFSMALTYCQQERRPFYEEHDGNRLVHSMVRSARGMG